MNLSKTKLQLYSNLATAKMRRKRGLFIVEGCKSVADSWRAFDVEAILRTEGSDFSIEGCRAPIFTLCEEDMRRVSNLATRQEAIGVFRIPSDDGQESAIVSADGLYLLLDGTLAISAPSYAHVIGSELPLFSPPAIPWTSIIRRLSRPRWARSERLGFCIATSRK